MSQSQAPTRNLIYNIKRFKYFSTKQRNQKRAKCLMYPIAACWLKHKLINGIIFVQPFILGVLGFYAASSRSRKYVSRLAMLITENINNFVRSSEDLPMTIKVI